MRRVWLVAHRLGVLLVRITQHALEAVGTSADRADWRLEGEVVGLVAGQILVPSAAGTQLAFVQHERLHQVSLLVVPLGFNLGDDLPSLTQAAGSSVLVVAALDGSRFPSVEPLGRDAERSSESKVSHLRRALDKPLRNC